MQHVATQTLAACISMPGISLTYINNSRGPRALPWGVATPKTGFQLSSCPDHIVIFKLFSEYDHFDNSVINRFNWTPIWDCFLFAAFVRAFSKHLALYSTGTLIKMWGYSSNTSAVSTKLQSADSYGLPCSDRSNTSKVITTLAFNN